MKIRVKDIRTVSIITLLSIILSGASVISYVRVPRIWLCGILGILGVAILKKTMVLNMHTVKLWGVWCIFLLISSMYSYVPINTLNGAVIYFCFFILVFLNYTEDDMKLILKVIRFVCIFLGISIIISVLIPKLFTDYLAFLVATDSNVLKTEIKEGIYSGLAGEKSNAAFYMNIGIALELALYNKEKKWQYRNYLFIAIYIIALMLTGKRTLLLVSFLIIALAIKLFDIKGKYAKIFLSSFLIIPLIIIILNFIPQTKIVIERLLNNSTDQTMNGRKKFWDFCMYMLNNKFLFGYGYDTFNAVFSDIVHYVYNGKVWDMYAHNIYYELLGETGIIGFLIFFSASISLLFKSISCFKKQTLAESQKILIFFSAAIQIIFLIYGCTGNVIYAHYELGFYFTAFIIYKTVIFELYNKKEIDSVKKF